jgi:hypothetical protein
MSKAWRVMGKNKDEGAATGQRVEFRYVFNSRL